MFFSSALTRRRPERRRRRTAPAAAAATTRPNMIHNSMAQPPISIVRRLRASPPGSASRTVVRLRQLHASARTPRQNPARSTQSRRWMAFVDRSSASQLRQIDAVSAPSHRPGSCARNQAVLPGACRARRRSRRHQGRANERRAGLTAGPGEARLRRTTLIFGSWG